jgi:uncharacterized protein involved in high-affinity Fe2+ transport
MKKIILSVTTFLTINLWINAQELVIGEERIEPGIIFVFEGAIKDKIIPSSMHLSEKQTNVHIEARVNWDIKNVPAGTPKGGFIPYLHITAKITNQKSGLSTFIDLHPHLNLIDNFHYARNISLPGSISDMYTVDFNIIPPSNIELALHNDWVLKYGENFLVNKKFKYHDVDFEEIAKSSRK